MGEVLLKDHPCRYFQPDNIMSLSGEEQGATFQHLCTEATVIGEMTAMFKQHMALFYISPTVKAAWESNNSSHSSGFLSNAVLCHVCRCVQSTTDLSAGAHKPHLPLLVSSRIFNVQVRRVVRKYTEGQ